MSFPFDQIKTISQDLRNTIAEDRLNGMALMSIHKDITINPEDVLNCFAEKKIV